LEMAATHVSSNCAVRFFLFLHILCLILFVLFLSNLGISLW
jgi:hypothetical protein